MFILLLHYDVEALEKLDALIPEHYEYVDRHIEDGTFLLTGRRVPRTGGVILANAADRATVERLTAEDPLLRSGAVRYEIIEFVTTRSTIPGVRPQAETKARSAS